MSHGTFSAHSLPDFQQDFCPLQSATGTELSGGCPVSGTILSKNTGLFSSDTSCSLCPSVVTNTNVSRYCQMPFRGQTHSWLQPHVELCRQHRSVASQDSELGQGLNKDEKDEAFTRMA